MASGLWSGLVQGLGSSMQQGFQQARDVKDREQSHMFDLISSALMNDPNLTGEHKRTGLRAIAKQFKIKIPDNVIEAIAPDDQVETDKFKADQVPGPRPDANLPSMPAPPPSFQQLQAVGPTQVDAGTAPGDVSPMPKPPASMQQQGNGNEYTGAMSDFVPRDPMSQSPQVLGAQAPGAQTSSPIMDKYTAGAGATYDDLDLQMKLKQLEGQLASPPSRGRQRSTQSSLNMSRAQMDEMRARRLQQEQDERNLTLGQIQDTMRLQQSHKEQMRQIQLEPLMMKAKMDSMEQALGHSLTDQQKERALGVGPQGPELERQLEANDYRDMVTKKGTPEGEAASQRVHEREINNTYKLSEVQKNAQQIATQRELLKDPTSNPKLVAAAKVNAIQSAAGMWSISARNQYLEDRTKYWEQQLQQQDTSGLNIQPNPLQMRAKAIEFAKKDVSDYQTNLQEKIYQLGFLGGKGLDKIVTLDYVRRRAEAARKFKDKAHPNGLDPNGVWTYWKQNGIILDDNLDVWQEGADAPAKPKSFGTVTGTATPNR